MSNPVQDPARPVPAAPTRTAEPAMDMLFGRFWPETGLPGSVRAVLSCLGVGLLAGIVLPFRDLGLGTFLVLLAAGGVILRFSVHRRSPFTLACAALCALLAATVVVRDAEWIVVLCLLAGGAVCVAGAGERSHPARLRARRHRLAARRAARAPVAGPLRARGHRARKQRGGAAHGRLVGAGGRRLRAAVRLGRRGLRRVGRTRSSPT